MFLLRTVGKNTGYFFSNVNLVIDYLNTQNEYVITEDSLTQIRNRPYQASLIYGWTHNDTQCRQVFTLSKTPPELDTHCYFFSPKKFALEGGAKEFREVYKGCSIFLNTGERVKASRVTKLMLDNYLVKKIYDPELNKTIRANFYREIKY